MKKHKGSMLIRRKAALAAFAFISLSPVAIRAQSSGDLPISEATLPAVPDQVAELQKIREAFYGNLAEAPVLMKSFLARYPASVYRAEVTLMLADWYFYDKEYSLAFDCYNRLRDDSFSGDTREGMLFRKAFSQIKIGYYKDAARILKPLLSSKKFGRSARFYLAYIDYVEGNYDRAYSEFQAIKNSGAKGAEAEYYINQIDYLRGENHKVAVTSERLLSSGTVPLELRGETMRVGGLANFKLGNKVMAKSLLSQYNDMAGNGAEISAVYSLATIYYDEGDYDKALPLFSDVTEYPGPLAQSSWLYIGQIYTARGDAGAAALAFDKASRESWDDDVTQTASYNLAVSSAEGGALPFSDAAAAMESFIVSYPSSPYSASLSRYLANAYYGRRNYQEALKQVDRIPVQDAETKAMRQKILYQIGVSELQQGQLDQSVKTLTEAASSQYPSNDVSAQAQLWLGDAYYAKKDYSSAAKAYRAAVASGKLGRNDALANYNLGYACLKLKNYKEAEAAFKAASSGSGLTAEQQSDALMRYGDCLYYNGKYSEALAVFKKIKSVGGQDAVFASIREADILGRNGKIDEKISILEGLYNSETPSVWQPTVVSRLADAYSEKGDDKKAAQLYADMLDSTENEADKSEIYYSLAVNAENLYNSGDKAAALDAYRRLESSGIEALYPSAVMGIMRSSGDNAEVIAYAAKAAATPGLSAEEIDEARFMGAAASLASGKNRKEAVGSLRSLSESSDRLWGARAAVLLGETLLREGDAPGAEEVLLGLIDNGSDDNYWLARGYIVLADVYMAQDKDYLARLYLDTLRNNYPGKESDIKEMISSRLKKLDK